MFVTNINIFVHFPISFYSAACRLLLLLLGSLFIAIVVKKLQLCLIKNMAYYGSRNVIVEKCKNTFCFDLDCGFVHTYQYCFLFQNTNKCGNDVCPFLHQTSMEQLRYETTGVATESLKSEIGRTLQNKNICRNFKNNACKRTECKLRHITLNVSNFECFVCTNVITVENFGTGNCGHIFCHDCACMLHDDTVETETINVSCPVCRSKVKYIKLM